MNPVANKVTFRNFIYYIVSQNEKNMEEEIKEEQVRYKHIELDSYRSDDWKLKVFAFIGKEYTNPELCLKMVARAVAKNEKYVSSLIQEEYRMSFKRYLNGIRLQEAKRLIQNDYLSLKEISFLVGYSNANHFTRVFKEFEGVTPTIFRDELTKKTRIS